MNSGDLLAELLIAHGVEYVFGAIGGQGYPLNDALHRRRSKARHIAVRDERSSAYAADGYARVSGKVGVCDAAFGVGVLKLPSGLAEAYNSSIPVLGILSNAPRDWMVWNERGCTAQGVEQVSPLTHITKGDISRHHPEHVGGYDSLQLQSGFSVPAGTGGMRYTRGRVQRGLGRKRVGRG